MWKGTMPTNIPRVANLRSYLWPKRYVYLDLAIPCHRKYTQVNSFDLKYKINTQPMDAHYKVWTYVNS